VSEMVASELAFDAVGGPALRTCHVALCAVSVSASWNTFRRPSNDYFSAFLRARFIRQHIQLSR
jgi:hypothetical protein